VAKDNEFTTVEIAPCPQCSITYDRVQYKGTGDVRISRNGASLRFVDQCPKGHRVILEYGNIKRDGPFLHVSITVIPEVEWEGNTMSSEGFGDKSR